MSVILAFIVHIAYVLFNQLYYEIGLIQTGSGCLKFHLLFVVRKSVKRHKT